VTLEIHPAGAQRILVGTAASLTSYKLDATGEPANPGTVTVTVTRADGSTVATAAATTEGADFKLSYSLSASNNSRLDWLKAVWTDAGDSTSWTTWYEVVGGYYFTVAQARALDPALTALDYPAADLLSLRDEIEREFESPQAIGRGLVPRYMRERLHGDNTAELFLSVPDLRRVRSILAVDPDGTTWEPFASATIAAIPANTDGAARLEGYTWPSQPIVIEYEYGIDRPPSDLVRAIVRRLRYVSAQPNSGVPDRATTFSAGRDGGTYGLAVEGRAGFITALPDVDLLIRRYRVRGPFG
jgi:hypothetical protein